MSVSDLEAANEVAGRHLVRLLRFPLRVFARADEHYAELMREFALLAMSTHASGAGHDVPRRLLALIDALNLEYAGTTTAPDAVRDAALADGAASIDLHYEVPAPARDAALRLDGLLDEADGFCRRGDRLLTLAAPADVLVFRQWYLSEFVRQIDGGTPSPWPGGLD